MSRRVADCVNGPVSEFSAASSKVWMDAYRAAIALNCGMRMVTLDRAFTAFERQGLRLQLLAEP